MRGPCRWWRASALLLALAGAGAALYAVQVAWFPARSQRLAAHGRTAPAVVVRAIAWGGTANVPTGSGVPVRPALRVKVLYNTGPRVFGAVIGVAGDPAVRAAQRRHGELIVGTPLRVVYDPAHPGVAALRSTVTPAPGRVAAAWSLAAVCALAAAGVAWARRRRER